MRRENNEGNKRLFIYLFNKFIKRKKMLICIGTSLQNTPMVSIIIYKYQYYLYYMYLCIY